MRASGVFGALLVLIQSLGMSVCFAKDLDLTTVYSDEQIGCLDAQWADSITKTFGISRYEYLDANDLCDNKNPLKILLNTIAFIEQMKFSSGGGVLDRGFSDNNYFIYLKNRIHTISYTERVFGGFVAHVWGHSSTMNITKLFIETSLVERVGALIHEARHSDGYSHVACETGVYKGQRGTCDASFDDGGAYGVEAELYARMAIGSANLHPKIKETARILLSGLLYGTNFNRIPQVINLDFAPGPESKNQRPTKGSVGKTCTFSSGFSDHEYLNDSSNFDTASLKRVNNGAVGEILAFAPVTYKGNSRDGVSIKLLSNPGNDQGIAVPGEVLWSYLNGFCR